MSSYSNFAQFVGYYIVGKPLDLGLTLDWSTAKPKKGTTLVIVTQPAVRRALHIMETPLKVSIPVQDQEAIAEVLSKNSVTAAKHVAKFDEQAAVAQENKLARAALKEMRAFLDRK